jgi:DNA-binding IclR family transcriptional regulator
MKDVAHIQGLGAARRVVALMQALTAAREAPAGVSELAARSGLALATAHRILGDLEAMGLAYRDGERRWVANFAFERQVPLAAAPLARARAAMERVGAHLGMASEIVVPRGDALVWHAKFEPRDQSIRLRAHAGYARTIYELDALSRLALRHAGIAAVEARCDLSAFFATGVDGARQDWPAARATIAAVDPDGVAFDMSGNSKGVRRFAVALRRADGLACLLTAVEAAIPVRDPEARRACVVEALLSARDAAEIGEDIGREARIKGGKE